MKDQIYQVIQVPIVDVPLHIGQKTEQLDLLDKEIAKRQDTIRQLIEEYNITTEDKRISFKQTPYTGIPSRPSYSNNKTSYNY